MEHNKSVQVHLKNLILQMTCITLYSSCVCYEFYTHFVAVGVVRNLHACDLTAHEIR